jgi:hypothetical protein
VTPAVQWGNFLLGLFWGSAVSAGNYFYLQRIIKKNAKHPDRSPAAIVSYQIIRYFIDVLALLLVYKHLWVLVGTGLGLTVMKNVMMIQELRRGKKKRSGPIKCKAPERLDNLDLRDWHDDY